MKSLRAIARGAVFMTSVSLGVDLVCKSVVVRGSVVVPVITAPKQPSVLEGKTIVLPCEAAGIPAPTVSWRRRNDGSGDLKLLVSVGRYVI